jgi:hypothetical protein
MKKRLKVLIVITIMVQAYLIGLGLYKLQQPETGNGLFLVIVNYIGMGINVLVLKYCKNCWIENKNRGYKKI